MTVQQIIEEFRKLSLREQEEVRTELGTQPFGPEARFLSREEARRISKSFFAEFDDLFRKLSQ